MLRPQARTKHPRSQHGTCCDVLRSDFQHTCCLCSHAHGRPDTFRPLKHMIVSSCSYEWMSGTQGSKMYADMRSCTFLLCSNLQSMRHEYTRPKQPGLNDGASSNNIFWLHAHIYHMDTERLECRVGRSIRECSTKHAAMTCIQSPHHGHTAPATA